MKNKIIVGINNASLTSPNLGVQALTYSVIMLVAESLKEIDKEIEFYIFDSYKELKEDSLTFNGKTFNIKSFRFTFSKKIIFDKLFKKNILNNWKKCNVILDVSGGDSWSDIYGKKRFYVSFISMLIIFKLKKPLILTPQTIGPFDNWLVRKFANYAMKKALKVYPRDQKSANYIKEHLIKNDHSVIPDMALFMPYNQSEKLEDEINIGLNVSGLLFHGGYTKNNQFGLIVEYQKLMTLIIDYFESLGNIKIHLISHVIEEKSGNVEDDVWAANEIKKKYKNLIVAKPFKTPIEAKSYISRLDFFMGARMHSTIAAFSTGVPVVPMAYSRKFSGLFKDTLGYNHVVDLKKMNNNECLASIKEHYQNRMIIREKIFKIKKQKLDISKHEFLKELKKDFIKASIL